MYLTPLLAWSRYGVALIVPGLFTWQSTAHDRLLPFHLSEPSCYPSANKAFTESNFG